MIYEIISSKLNLPIQINFLKDEIIEKQFGKYPKIYLSLNDGVTVETKGENYVLNKNEIIVINSNVIHSIKTIDSLVIETVINSEYFRTYYSGFENIVFEDIPLDEKKYGEAVGKLGNYIAEIINSHNKNSSNNCLTTLNIMVSFTEFLIGKFMIEKTNDLGYILNDSNKIHQIIDYIDKNYGLEISLKETATALDINPQYLSRFFKQQAGIGFLNYLNKVRIKKSLKCLLGTNKSILEVAIDYGYNDSKTYTRAFKQEFIMTPGEYRKKVKQENLKTRNTVQYIDKEYFVSMLSEFMNSRGKKESETDNVGIFTVPARTVNMANAKPYKKQWSRIMAFERAYTLTRLDVQEQIKRAASEIKFEYLKFCGIFNDEMMIYNEEENGKVVYNWNYADKIFDFLKSIKVKPFINIGYMPEQLAGNKQYIFFYRANVSYPKSIEKWNCLVEDFIKHLMGRYGKEEVDSWYMEIWNNPNVAGMYWYEGDEKYFYFYENTCNVIKKVSNKIKVGGPSIAITPSIDNGNYSRQWILRFFDYLEKTGTEIDFFSIHSFPIGPGEDDKNIIHDKLRYKTFKGVNRCFIRNANSLKEDIEFVNEILEKRKPKKLPLIVSEWNAEPVMESSINDTCFLATNIVYNALNNIGNTEALVYWTLSDIFEEYGTFFKMFHGSFGLLTYNGLKKASYNAYCLLSRLGDNVVTEGDGYFICKSEKGYEILLYNYVYFDELSRFKLSYGERRSYKTMENKQFYLKLKNISNGMYKIKKTYLNENSGSIFEAWEKMGAPEQPDDEVIEFLKAKQKMDLYTETAEIAEEYKVCESLVPHGIMLIEIEKLN